MTYTDNQREKLLRALERAPLCGAEHPAGPGRWLSVREILLLGIAQYGARISELRKCGWQIENRTKFDELRQERFSWYRLVPREEQRGGKAAA